MSGPNADFSTYFRDVIEPALAAKEGERRKAVRNFTWIVGAGGAATLALFAGVAAWTDAQLGLFAAAFAGFATAAGAAYSLSRVRTDTKAILMNAIADFGAFQFHPTPPFADVEAFRMRRLVPDWDRKQTEDGIEGARLGAPFVLYEAHLEVETRDKDGRSSYSTVFRGQLIRITFPKSFLGETLVLRDKGIFNALSGPGRGLARVGLVDPRFEKIFEVYGTDQVEARYLLTPTFMERLIGLETLLNGKSVRCAFFGGGLMIAIEGGNLFEPGSMFKPLADLARAEAVLADVRGIEAVIAAVLAPRIDAPS